MKIKAKPINPAIRPINEDISPDFLPILQPLSRPCYHGYFKIQVHSLYYNKDMAEIRQIEKAQINFNSVMQLSQDAVMARLNCHNIGRILDFDPATQTCSIQLMQIKQFNKQQITPTILTEVPLIIYGAGGGHITMPDPTGTICILLFMDRNIDAFLETSEPYTPLTSRMHDFTDCIALTTFKTLVNPLTGYDEKAVTIMNEEIIEEVKQKSFIKVYSQQILMQNSLGGQISVGEKINIQNNQQNLANLIQSFLAACESITTVNGGALTPASKQLFMDLKTQFGELLE